MFGGGELTERHLVYEKIEDGISDDLFLNPLKLARGD